MVMLAISSVMYACCLELLSLSPSFKFLIPASSRRVPNQSCALLLTRAHLSLLSLVPETPATLRVSALWLLDLSLWLPRGASSRRIYADCNVIFPSQAAKESKTQQHSPARDLSVWNDCDTRQAPQFPYKRQHIGS